MEIYFDNSATTKICNAALERYIEVSSLHYGNPSSRHKIGKDAEDILKASKQTIMKTLGTDNGSLVFTSGGTEANNLAIFGRAYSKERYRGCRILTTDGEHSSVSEPLARLEAEGFEIIKIPTRGGVLDIEALKNALTPKTVLATFMLVNNETGACYDIKSASRLIHTLCSDCVLHVDATQAYMKMPVNVKSMGIDMLTVSSHKIEGPKGMGALWIEQAIITKRGISARVLGGGQESGLRSGTENLPGIAAFAAACEAQKADFSARIPYIRELRDYLIEKLSDSDFSELSLVLPKNPAPHILNIILPKIKSETMLNYLSEKGICISSGSACSSRSKINSGALSAFGISPENTDYSIRISFSQHNTKEEIDIFAKTLLDGINSLQRVK